MLVIKKAVIIQVDLYTDGLKTLRAAFPGMKYIPGNTQTSPLNLIQNLFLKIKFVTLNGEEYESKTDWCLFSWISNLEEYTYVSSLLELLNGGQEEVELEELQEKEVCIIVDDTAYPKRDTVLALGVNNKYVVANWIAKCDKEGRTYYMKEEAIGVLSKFV